MKRIRHKVLVCIYAYGKQSPTQENYDSVCLTVFILKLGINLA